MTQHNTGPVAIMGGRIYPITAEQYALNRAGKPMGHIPGYSGPAAAAARPVQPKPAAMDPAEVARKAAAFDARMAGQTPPPREQAPAPVQARGFGVDAKTLAAPGPLAGSRTAALDGRALSRANMEKHLRAQGIEPVKR